jgi:hypothetical protein
MPGAARQPEDSRSPGAGPGGIPWLPSYIIGACVLIASSALVQWRCGLNPDVAWFLNVAQRVREGATLYLDAPGSMIEVNPPLVIWMLMPALRLASMLGLKMTAAPVLLVVVEALVGIGLSALVVRRAAVQARGLPWLIAIVGLCLPAHDFAQREHQAVLLLAPLLIAIVVAPDGVGLSVWLRTLIGVSAGLGVSLKPHFALAWVACEVACALMDRAPRRLLRTETYAAAAVVVAYCIAVLTVAPDYLRLIQLWGPLYLRMMVKPIPDILLMRASLLSLAALAVAWPSRRVGVEGRAAVVFAVAATAFILAVVIQHKGFDYHFFPAFAFALLSVAITALRRARARLTWPLSPVLGLLYAGTLILSLERLAIGIVFGEENRRLTASYGRLATSSEVPPARDPRGFAVLSADLRHPFPMVTELGLRWPLRVPSLWVLPTVAQGCRPAGDQDRALERRFTDAVWDDLARANVAVMVIAPLPVQMHPRPGCTTIADHLAREPRFAQLFAAYAATDTIPRNVYGPFVVLRRRAQFR